ncbi:hypothetical protein [Erwinia amylovora]|uniref:hypothetical protein n=1 Tax=Erwinia amylovora TaxID=552 RepID=UPI00144451E4|nr:hypothetical protein [Erwinia amylovora]
MKLTVDRVVNEPNDVAISIDGYVPIDIKIFESKGFPPLYWRIGNGKRSLLEFAVLPENGFLSAITLVIIDPDSVQKVDKLQVEISGSENGFPVADLELWECSNNNDFSQRFVDDFNFDIQAFTSSDSILLLIGENKDETRWIKCSDTFCLGINDKGNITHLFLDKLTEEAVHNFFESIG